MPTVDVYDPSTGRDIRLAVITRKGKTFYKRIPVSLYDPASAPPRRLEARAAFATAASSAYGKRRTSDAFPAQEAVREQVPQLMSSVPRETSTAELRQQFYRSLLTDEERELLENMQRQEMRGRVVSRPTPGPVAITERKLPGLRMMPLPEIY